LLHTGGGTQFGTGKTPRRARNNKLAICHPHRISFRYEAGNEESLDQKTSFPLTGKMDFAQMAASIKTNLHGGNSPRKILLAQQQNVHRAMIQLSGKFA